MAAITLQPPLGGCVLKPYPQSDFETKNRTAAFRRLCVETKRVHVLVLSPNQPPLGGCVLKLAAQSL